MRRLVSRAALPSADFRSLAAAAARTAAVRGVLAAALTLALVAAVVSARASDASVAPPARGESAIVVVDLSLSIPPATLREMGRVVARVAAADRPTGLVVFSDVPYELLPPGTPARELRPLLRFLTPLPPTPAERRIPPRFLTPRFPADPWSGTFRGGTRISSALELAREMLEREGGRGSILLVSDLDTADGDVEPLRRTLAGLRAAFVRLDAVSLNALAEDVALFRDAGATVREPPGIVLPRAWSAAPRQLPSAPLPLALVAAALVLLALVALNELACARLELPTRSQREARA